MADIFQCGIHDFSTDDIILWDKHCAEIDHEYDLHIKCSNGCGKKLHIKPSQKVSEKSYGIPRGYVCSDCKDKVQTVSEIKEAGEIK